MKDNYYVTGNEEITKTKFIKELRNMAIVIVLALLATLFIRNSVFARADVDGKSMQSTLQDKDILFVEKICLFKHDFKRGQIIIFNSHLRNNDIFVKRIIALEGDTVEIKNGKVIRNGIELKEDYLDLGVITVGDTFLTDDKEYVVPKGCVFVMGDNRGDSSDSRKIGPVKIKDIKGHVIIRAFPFKNIKKFS